MAMPSLAFADRWIAFTWTMTAEGKKPPDRNLARALMTR
jgi:hypothetical protein